VSEENNQENNEFPKIPGLSASGGDGAGIQIRRKRVSISTLTGKGKKISRKWYLVFGGVIVVVVAAATMLAPKPPAAPKPKAQVQRIAILPNAIGNSSFDRSTESALSDIQEKYDRVLQQQDKMAKALGDSQKTETALQKQIKEQDAEISAQRKLLAEQAAEQSKAPAQLPPPVPPPSMTPPPPAPMAPPAVEMPSSPSNTTVRHNGFGLVVNPSPEQAAAKSGAKITENIVKNRYAGFLPAGSFLPAVLLTGIEANTANSAQGNPEPVLIRVQRNAILPNGGHYHLAGCFVIGSATGSISARRADIRLTTLSCTNQKHKMVLEAPIKGYAVDSDGKFGLRGTLVERRGSILEKSLLAGFASGLGGALGNGQGTMYSGTYGTGQVLTGVGSAFEEGASNGLNNAMNQLAQFYLNQAKNIFPVIEVPSGRKVTLVIVKGASYHWHNAHSLYVLQKHPVKVVTPVTQKKEQKHD
jgi:conjugal transfer pilus assembly protein TraB